MLKKNKSGSSKLPSQVVVCTTINAPATFTPTHAHASHHNAHAHAHAHAHAPAHTRTRSIKPTRHLTHDLFDSVHARTFAGVQYLSADKQRHIQLLTNT